MKEIKMKIWDKEKKEFYKPIYRAYENELYVLLLNVDNGSLCIEEMTGLRADFDQDRFVKLLYTGFQDINDKEIFAKDIIEYDFSLDGKERCCAVVEWLGDGLNPKCGWGIGSVNLLHELSHIEVKGNVFENLELLEEQNETSQPSK